MPGEPQDVRVNAINSTTLHVIWKEPLEKDRNGIIMGYHIHVQETKEEVCLQLNFFLSLRHFNEFFHFASKKTGSQLPKRANEIRCD